MAAPLQYFQTAAEMTAQPIVGLSDHFPAILAGVTTINDGLGGIFYFDITSVLAPNGTTVFAPDVGSGRWRKLNSETTPRYKQFLVAASSWPWNHALGFRPLVEVYDLSWVKMLAYTENTDDDNLTVTHGYNATGWLVIR